MKNKLKPLDIPTAFADDDAYDGFYFDDERVDYGTTIHFDLKPEVTIEDTAAAPFAVYRDAEFDWLLTHTIRAKRFARETYVRAAQWAIRTYHDSVYPAVQNRYHAALQWLSDFAYEWRYALYATTALTIALLWLAQKLLG